MRVKPPKIKKNLAAFGLVDLMVSLVVFSIVGVAIYFGFGKQAKEHLIEKDLAHLQTNIRNISQRLTGQFRQFLLVNSRSDNFQLAKVFKIQKGCRISKGTGSFNNPFINDAEFLNDNNNPYIGDCVRFLYIKFNADKDLDQIGSKLVIDYDPANYTGVLLHDLTIPTGEGQNFEEGKLYVISDGKHYDPFLLQKKDTGSAVLPGGTVPENVDLLQFDPAFLHDASDPDAGLGGIYPVGSTIFPVELVDYAIDQASCMDSGCNNTKPALISGNPLALLGTPDYNAYYRPLAIGFEKFVVDYYAPAKPIGFNPVSDYEFTRGLDLLLSGRTMLGKKQANGQVSHIKKEIKNRIKFIRFRSSQF